MTDVEFTTAAASARLFMLRIAGQIAGREHAEDVVSDALLRAWRFRHYWNGEATIGTWLYAIARNAAHDANRKRLARPQRPDGPDDICLENAVDQSPNPEQLLRSKEIAVIVRSEAAKLPRTLREELEAWLEDGRVAANDNTRKVRLFRARNQIAPALKRALYA